MSLKALVGFHKDGTLSTFEIVDEYLSARGQESKQYMDEVRLGLQTQLKRAFDGFVQSVKEEYSLDSEDVSKSVMLRAAHFVNEKSPIRGRPPQFVAVGFSPLSKGTTELLSAEELQQKWDMLLDSVIFSATKATLREVRDLFMYYKTITGHTISVTLGEKNKKKRIKTSSSAEDEGDSEGSLKEEPQQEDSEDDRETRSVSETMDITEETSKDCIITEETRKDCIITEEKSKDCIITEEKSKDRIITNLIQENNIIQRTIKQLRTDNKSLKRKLCKMQKFKSSIRELVDNF